MRISLQTHTFFKDFTTFKQEIERKTKEVKERQKSKQDTLDYRGELSGASKLLKWLKKIFSKGKWNKLLNLRGFQVGISHRPHFCLLCTLQNSQEQQDPTGSSEDIHSQHPRNCTANINKNGYKRLLMLQRNRHTAKERKINST